MSDTPRTDEVMASVNWPYHITFEMKKLERELNATQAALEQMTRDALTTARDRDEWMARAMRGSEK